MGDSKLNHLFEIQYRIPYVSDDSKEHSVEAIVKRAQDIFKDFLKKLEIELKFDPELKEFGDADDSIEERRWRLAMRSNFSEFIREHHTVARQMFMKLIFRKEAFRRILDKMKRFPPQQREDYYKFQAMYARELFKIISKERGYRYGGDDLRAVYNDEYERLSNVEKRVNKNIKSTREDMKREEEESVNELRQKMFERVEEIKSKRGHLRAPDIFPM